MFDRYNFDAILIWFNWEVGKIKNEKKKEENNKASKGTINCRNNCRHEEPFKLTFRDIVWRGYTRLERVSPDTRDIIYGDSYGPWSDVYYVPCKCSALERPSRCTLCERVRGIRFVKNELVCPKLTDDSLNT